MHENETAARLRRRSKSTLFIILAVILGGIATATAPLWWESFTVIVEDLGNGDSRYIILDENGNVDFDEVLHEGDGLMQTEDGEYIIVEDEDSDSNQAEIDRILEEIEAEEKKKNEKRN